MQKKYKIIGVMSGTSLDGIDLAYIIFWQENSTWQFSIQQAETLAYPVHWVEKLKNLVNFSAEQLNNIDEDYTQYLANTVKHFIEKYDLHDVNAICSHGHTALHQPQKGLTYQIGNLPKLANLLGKTVVCDFRVQDVALGGQGAPLVPIGDKLLFAQYGYCLNLGGFANISTELNNERIAYDICPVNIVLNKYVGTLGLAYDNEGQLASEGNTNEPLLKQLSALPFYSKKHPKSLGLEWVDETIFPLIDAFKLNIKDVLRTFVEHIAEMLALEINKKENATVLVTGGGAYNAFLMQRLKHFANNKIIIPNKAIVEFKEALIFGFLGVLKLENKVNCLKSVTGAARDHSSGKIYYPTKIT
ncbi:MAG: anhydro-N-acetylmuramic acid kinase [Flavobacteriaceae bacterium]